eukprot:9427675-Pyramimonas_sp.AAC.1
MDITMDRLFRISDPADPAAPGGPKPPTTPGYYSTLAMVMHSWRNNAPTAFKLAKAKFGEDTALKHFRKLPPKPIVGRWGNT